ncbi:F-box/FBD/LRR-repeat protein At1g13570-like [Nicotiana tomentosiformis]|uniref:F-box/FBD/LRR-repeat protein At1g13570-like n=1 Tax=Nicotiana tomentosiformis TaxID=4098 RepID=UPI00388CA119
MPPKDTKQYCYRTSPPDIFSNLPENVIDEILICLPFKDAVRTSILSKKWKYNWCRLPELTLDRTIWTSKKDFSLFSTSEITYIIYHILILHDGPITKFILDVPRTRSCPKIDGLIYFLSMNGIQHLVLKLPLCGLNKLPCSLFTCFQLRHLTLENCLIHPPPAFNGFDRLISLELHDVTISSKFLESLIYHCPLLERLVLRIPQHLNVVEIKAPKLRSFKFTGSIQFITLKDVPLLAKLSLVDTGFVRADNFDIAMFFESFISLELLHLDSDSIKFFARAGEVVPKRLPFDLICVKRLYLSEISLNGFKVISFALCLIRSFPCLQYLEIQVDEEDDDDYIRPTLICLEVEAFSDMTLNHLKTVKLRKISGTRLEMQLIKLLLAKSPALVTMVIDPHYTLNSRKYVKVEAEISKFQRASSKAEVLYDVYYY